MHSYVLAHYWTTQAYIEKLSLWIKIKQMDSETRIDHILLAYILYRHSYSLFFNRALLKQKSYQKVWNTYHIPYIYQWYAMISYQMQYVMHTVNFDAT